MRNIRSGVVFGSLIAVFPILGSAAEPHYQINIPRERLDAALDDFARQTSLHIARFSDTIDGSRVAGPVTGNLSAQEALTALLSANGLTFDRLNAKTIAIVPLAESHQAASSAPPNAAPPIRVAAADSSASAQPAPEDIQEIVVTGTNIKRTDAAALPVTVLDANAFQAHDASTPSALLNSLPQVPNAPLNETANASFSARGDFDAVNLRGIGTGNTLVLLNGRRLVPHPISSTDENGLPDASVNVNQLPGNDIDHVEILRDGASSIYGTDAVAGVINYITDSKFNGVQFTGRLTRNEHGDGRVSEGIVKFGTDFADGKGHIVSMLDYYAQGAIFLKDRSFTADGDHTASAPAPWNAVSALIPLSANPFYGRQSTGTYPSFKVGTSTYFLVPQTNGTVSLTTTAPARGVNNADFFNLNQYQAIQPSSDRFNWYNQAEYRLGDRLTAFAELSIYRADSTLIRQPVAYNGGNFTDQSITVPASSQWNPFGQPVTLLSEYLTALGPERDTISDTVYRVLGGVRGTYGESWSWESAAYYTRGAVTDTGHNAVRQSLFNTAIQSGAYNPFGYTFQNQGGVITINQPYSNPTSVTAPFIGDFRKDGVSSIGSVDFRTSGKLVDLWAGPLSAAVGGEVREEEFKFSLPPYSGFNPPGSGLPTDDNDFLLFGPAANWSANRRVSSLYAEAVLPVVAPQNGIPFIRSLELTGSARYENYSDFGSTTKPKAGLSWRPVSWVMLRASYNQGFRAPNLPSLNGGERKTLQSFLDPVTQTTGPHWGIFAGNPNLKPETSVGKSFGIVVDVPKVDGLTLTGDYWQISQQNLITTSAITDVMNSDAALLAPIIAAHPGVPISQLSFGSGTANYKGDPRVVRNADNSVYSVTTPPFNAAKGYISGLDLSLSYRLPRWAIGQFQVRSDWAYLSSDYNFASAGAPENNLLDRDGTARWRGNAALGWDRNNWSAGLSAYYIGSFQASNVTLPVATAAQQAQSAALYASLGNPSYIAQGYNLGQVVYRYVVSSTTTLNAYVGYKVPAEQGSWLGNSSIRFGVVNLTNVRPPLSGGFTGYPTAVYTSLVAGRTWTLDVSKKF